jgi:hypothetical protein
MKHTSILTARAGQFFVTCGCCDPDQLLVTTLPAGIRVGDRVQFTRVPGNRSATVECKVDPKSSGCGAHQMPPPVKAGAAP